MGRCLSEGRKSLGVGSCMSLIIKEKHMGILQRVVGRLHHYAFWLWVGIVWFIMSAPLIAWGIYEYIHA